MHGALTTFGELEIQVRWEMMQKEHFGDEKFKEILALEEEERIAKEIQLKAFHHLQNKQGLANSLVKKRNND